MIARAASRDAGDLLHGLHLRHRERRPLRQSAPMRTRVSPSSVTWIVSAPELLRSFTRANTPTRPSSRAAVLRVVAERDGDEYERAGPRMRAQQREVFGGAHLHGDGAVGKDDRGAERQERQLGRQGRRCHVALT